MGGIGQEDLGEGEGGGGKGEAVEAVVAGGGEEAEGIPAVAPRVADALIGVQDEEGEAATGEVVADGEAGLAAADDDGVETFWVAHFVAPCRTWCESILDLLGREARRAKYPIWRKRRLGNCV